MTRIHWLTLAVLAAVVAGGVAPGRGGPPPEPAAAVAGAAVVAAAEPEPVDDPFPIARVRVPADRLAEALKALDPGPLVRLPRDEFEDRVRTAGRTAAAARLVPRLTDARYTAALTPDGDLLGTGEWEIVNPRPGPAWLSLDPLRVAVRSAAWADGSEAIVGVAGGSFPPGPGVWVPSAGRHTLRFAWSAAGTGAAGDPAFLLRLPPCPVAVLDLTLPADRTPDAGADVLLAGPEPAADGRRAWRVRFGGRSRLEFTARGPGAGPGPVVATLAARYDLSPVYLAATFDFDLQPTRGPAAGWSFAVPPGLRVTGVEANDLAGWRVDPTGRELLATLRRPGAGGKVRVEAAGPLPAAGEPLPVVRPVGAVGGDERVEVRVDPGLAVKAVEPGDYRLAEVSAGPDDARVFTFVGSRPAADPPPDRPGRRPPAVRVRGGDAAFTAFEAVEWRVAAGRVVLTARVTARPRRGPLFGLTVRTPAGFTLDRAVTAPDDRVAFAGPTVEGSGVRVEFARPVAVGQAVELVLSLRGPAVPEGGGRFPFPAVAAVEAAERDGWLAVCPGPGRVADARPDPGAVEVSPLVELDPPDPALPDDAAVAYLWRGREPAGDIALTPITPPTPAAGPPPAPVPPVPPPVFTDLRLVTTCSDPPTVAFEGAVRHGEPGFTVDLPAGAAVEAVTAGGRAVDPAGLGPGPGVRVPVPAADGPVRFEVRYRLGGGEGPWRRVDSPVPELPGGPYPLRRAWAFPGEVVPAWPVVPAGGEAGFAGDEFVVVPGGVADAAGVILAAGLAAVGWVVARRRGRWTGVLILLVVAGVGAGGLFGPTAWGRAARPAVAVGLVAAAAVVVARGGRSKPVRAAVAVLAVGGLAVHGQPAPGDAVVLLPSGDGPEVVLAPQPVLDRLAAAARPAVPGAVVTAAEYDGRAEDGTARFTGRFVVYTFADGETAVSLPLADGRLEAATADGQPAAVGSPRPGVYAVPVKGPGRHEVAVRFEATVRATGPEREVRFGVPEVPAGRVVFVPPAGAGRVQAVGRLGGRDGRAVDLGPARAVQLRWRQGPAGTPAVAVREGCVWDVTEAGDRLTACYLARVSAGAATGFGFDLPAELEPVRVAVQGLSPGAAVAVGGWTLGAEANGLRPLRVDLAGPADGRLLVTLECVRRGPPTRRPVLRFPRPTGVERLGGVYGLRAAGVAVEAVERAGVIDFAADALFREFGEVRDLRLSPAAPPLAFSPQPGAEAELRPVLRPGPEAPGVTQDVTWRVGPTRAEGEGTVRWVGKDQLPAVEFAVPGARVLEVRGADVAGWGQADGRVQVWLRRPAKGGEVGWVAAADPAAGAATVDLPAATVADAKPASTILGVISTEGLTAKAEPGRGWRAVSTGGVPGLAFRADGPAPPVRLTLAPAPVEPVPPPRPVEKSDLTPPPAEPVVSVAPPPAPVLPSDQPPALPVRTAVGWGLGVLLVAVLFLLMPRRTWPEQVGLLGGLWGVAVAGGPAVGLAAWGAARTGWLLSRWWRTAPIAARG